MRNDYTSSPYISHACMTSVKAHLTINLHVFNFCKVNKQICISRIIELVHPYFPISVGLIE